MKVVEVVAAIIVNDNEILCMQRDVSKFDYISKKFEFPGGKLEVGETLEEALTRELKEELDINTIVKANDYFLKVDHTYPDFRIILHAYIVNVKTRHFIMNEHIAFRWLDKAKLLELDWAKADMPIVKKLMEESYG